MRGLSRVLLAGAVVVVAAGCSASDGGSGAAPSDDTALDLTGSWQLVSASTASGEIPLVADAPVTLEVAADGTVSGRSACNRYSGTATIEGASLAFGPLAATRMACEGTVMTVESMYQQALATVDSGARTARDSLVLTGPDVELVFISAG
jgi:heat shock protein HslJ